MLGLHANVYKTGRFGRASDCTNGGISGRCEQVTVVGIEGAEIFEPTTNSPAVKLVRRVIGGEAVIHAEPVEPPPAGSFGWMAGGNFIATSDGRFGRAVGFYGAVSLHDRYETPAQYDMLSK